MAARRPPSPSTQHLPGWIWAARLSLAIALAGAGYLSWLSLTGATAAGCGPDSNCSAVLQSRWSHWFGIPVSFPAVLVYAAMLIGSFLVHPKFPPTKRAHAWLAIIFMSALVAGAAAWFVGLQVFVIQAICPFCLVTHMAGFLAAAVLWWNAPAQRPNKKLEPEARQLNLTPKRAARFERLGLASLLLLVAGQFLSSKTDHSVTTAGSVSGLPQEGTAARILQLHDGRFSLNLEQVPVIGSHQASNIIVSLFDYTCHHCRDLHELLIPAQQQFSNRLAIASLPMPLDATCNHLLSQTPPPHRNACEYARLSLAVWRAAPEKFNQFDHWLFDPAQPPPLSQAHEYAAQLVGPDHLQKALNDPWLNQQLKFDVALFEANSRKAKDSRMPQLILGEAIITGAISSKERLHELLTRHLDLSSSSQGAPTRP